MQYPTVGAAWIATADDTHTELCVVLTVPSFGTGNTAVEVYADINDHADINVYDITLS